MEDFFQIFRTMVWLFRTLLEELICGEAFAVDVRVGPFVLVIVCWKYKGNINFLQAVEYTALTEKRSRIVFVRLNMVQKLQWRWRVLVSVPSPTWSCSQSLVRVEVRAALRGCHSSLEPFWLGWQGQVPCFPPKHCSGWCCSHWPRFCSFPQLSRGAPGGCISARGLCIEICGVACTVCSFLVCGCAVSLP